MVPIPQTPIKEPHVPVTVLAIQKHLIVKEYKNSTVSVNKPDKCSKIQARQQILRGGIWEWREKKSEDLRKDQSHLLVFWTVIFSKNNVHLLPHSLHLMITSYIAYNQSPGLDNSGGYVLKEVMKYLFSIFEIFIAKLILHYQIPSFIYLLESWFSSNSCDHILHVCFVAWYFSLTRALTCSTLNLL